MATTAVHGRLTSIVFDSLDISEQCRQSSVSREGQEIDVTAYQADGREYLQDLPGATLTFEGNAADTIMDKLHDTLDAQLPVTVVYGAEGDASGKRKYTFSAILLNVAETTQSQGSANAFTASARITGGITRATYT